MVWQHQRGKACLLGLLCDVNERVARGLLLCICEPYLQSYTHGFLLKKNRTVVQYDISLKRLKYR